MKFEVRNFATLMSKKISRTNKERESEMVTKIIKLSSKINLSEEEMKDLTSAQAELDKIYEEKAKGAFVRSRRRWLEQHLLRGRLQQVRLSTCLMPCITFVAVAVFVLLPKMLVFHV